MQDLDIIVEDLSPEQRDICDCIGVDAYAKLVRRYGGLSLYIAKADTVVRFARDERIRQDFNGYNYKFLSAKYNLTERTIRSITSDTLQKIKTAPLEGQITFDNLGG